MVNYFMDTGSSVVKSADRALDLFEVFESIKKPLLLKELAEMMGIPLSSCHGIVRTLQQRGYLYLTGRRKELYPTRRLWRMATAIAASDPLLSRVEPILHRLQEKTAETVILGKRQGDAVLYLEVIEGVQTIRYVARPGEYKPLHSSSIGKALLGALRDDELQAWLQSHSLPAITPNTITDPGRLLADLQAGRERGYFVTRGENVMDVMAVATPCVVDGEVLGIAVAGPLHRMERHLENHVAALLEGRRALE